LVPSDFLLFGLLKGKLKLQVFDSHEAVRNAVNDILHSTTPETLVKVFNDWKCRCVEVMKDGEYHD
jgi:hypothetical protein